jgi:hypothetical protein
MTTECDVVVQAEALSDFDLHIRRRAIIARWRYNAKNVSKSCFSDPRSSASSNFRRSKCPYYGSGGAVAISMKRSFVHGTELGTRPLKISGRSNRFHLSRHSNLVSSPPYPPLSAEARTSVSVHGPAGMPETRVCVARQLVDTFVSILHDIAQITVRQRHRSRRLPFVLVLAQRN